MRTRLKLWIAVAFLMPVMWSTGCGGATHSGADDSSQGTAGGEDAVQTETEWNGAETAFQFSSTEQDVIAEFDDEWESLGSRFGEAVTQAGAVDCGTGAEYAEAICDLASRICEIAERHPESPSVQERCASGQSGCESAREDMGQHCG